MRVLPLVLVLLGASACGHEEEVRIAPDSEPEPQPDAPVSYPACDEFATQGVIVPVHFEGTLAGADVVSPTECAITNAPFGADSAGPDRVIPLRGLRPGTAYVIKLTSASDLQFYVTTGCATPSGPGADQCLLFEDESLDETELGRFIAGGSTAYVVVDFYASHEPDSNSFTLDVYEEQCREADQCGAATPACSEGRCVECVSSFDCHDAAASSCDAVSHTCAAGANTCYGDDASEPADDGPAGARVLVLDGANRGSVTGSMCASPTTEDDFIAFDVTSLGDTWDFQLAWTGTKNLDLRLFDARGTLLGMSLWEHPERVRLTYLPLGRYFVRVTEQSSTADPTAIAYSLTAIRSPGTPCTAAADCAGEFRNQVYRGSCEAGACVAIQGDGAFPEGTACDSQSDCGGALHCPSFFFVESPDTRNTCARGCGTDDDCAPLGAGVVCTSYLANNFCVAKCTDDAQCPTAPSSVPQSGPWFRLSCDLPTGRCLP